jgi:hypothetical protein
MIDQREPYRKEISAEDIIARMPPDMVGADKVLYLAALKKTISTYSEAGAMECGEKQFTPSS